MKIAQTIRELYYKTYSWVTGKFVVTDFRVLDTRKCLIYTKSYGIHDDVSIIIQGPLIKNKNILLINCLELRKKYPSVQIIFSTWKNSECDLIEQLRINKIDVVESQPVCPGLGNVNLQIKSTSVGFDAIRPNVKYVLKLRSDQLLLSDADFIGYFKSLLQRYPCMGDGLVKRLLVSNFMTRSLRMYGVPDYMMFGHLSDMRLFWNPDFDEKKSTDYIVEPNPQYFMRQATAEGYLVAKFMNLIGFNPQWTIQDSRVFFAKYFLVADGSTLEQIWIKYKWWNGYCLNNDGKRESEISPVECLTDIEKFKRGLLC